MLIRKKKNEMDQLDWEIANPSVVQSRSRTNIGIDNKRNYYVTLNKRKDLSQKFEMLSTVIRIVESTFRHSYSIPDSSRIHTKQWKLFSFSTTFFFFFEESRFQWILTSVRTVCVLINPSVDFMIDWIDFEVWRTPSLQV